MNESDEFWDFAAFWEFFNPFDQDENKVLKCPHCGRVIKGNEEVLWVDKKKRIFKCPECEEEVKIE